MVVLSWIEDSTSFGEMRITGPRVLSDTPRVWQGQTESATIFFVQLDSFMQQLAISPELIVCPV